jgi:hypothetical protein
MVGYGHVTRRAVPRALDAALVHDDLTTHEDHCCAIATAGPRAPTSCNPFVYRSTVVCTPAQPQSSLASHTHTPSLPSAHGRTRSWSGYEGDIDSASLTQRAMYEHVSHKCDCGWEPTAQQAHSIPFASIVVSMLPLPCLARHAALHLAAPCYAGGGTSRNPNVPPARLAAFACVVCVCGGGWCDVPVPVDVFLSRGCPVVPGCPVMSGHVR